MTRLDRFYRAQTEIQQARDAARERARTAAHEPPEAAVDANEREVIA
ncbi:hypothetical protein ACFC3F_06635 [Microbacterium sp. NPDC055910]